MVTLTAEILITAIPVMITLTAEILTAEILTPEIPVAAILAAHRGQYLSAKPLPLMPLF